MSVISETPDGDRQRCAEPGCLAGFRFTRWAKTRAQSAGWFFQRDGDAWCPQHVPSWVPGWREGKNGDDNS